MATQCPVRNSIRKVDLDTWLIGEKLLLTRSASTSSNSLWSYDNSSYSISNVDEEPPQSQLLENPSSGPIQLVHDAGDISAVWAIGGAFLKIKSLEPNSTREQITLSKLKEMQLNFAIPDVIYHGEWDGRLYLILSKVPGRTLTEAWPTMDDERREHCVKAVANICNNLAECHGRRIGGIDGNQLHDPFLVKRKAEKDFSHENLLRSCKELNMHGTTFHFFHCDLGPGNLLIDDNGSLGVIDWEMAGYVPKEWIRTRFRISSGMDLPVESPGEKVDWRRRMQIQLGNEGYHDVANIWESWWKGE